MFTPKEGAWPRPADAGVRAKPLLPNRVGALPEADGYGSTRLPSPNDGRCNPPKAPPQTGGPRGNELRPNPSDEDVSGDAKPERPLVGVDIARLPKPGIGDVRPAGKVIGMPTLGGDEKKSGC